MCEVLGLKWEDIDIIEKTASVLRSYVDGGFGPCKTEVSQQPLPLDEIAIEGLIAWRVICPFGADTDSIFGSERAFGKLPVWPDSLRSTTLQPAAKKAGIRKRIGWHTFAHLQLAAGRNRQRCESSAGADVARKGEYNNGGVTHAGMDKKRIAEQGRRCALQSRNPTANGAVNRKCSHTVPIHPPSVPKF
ncbi:site-specific integrase [Tunturibacter empetritectus]|uniref:Uncharacterized protein n=1 Tax=Tunturiibacter empetritectus TaxID=3069691 RepID=A0A7W8MR19_9BACT|nr:hypothetical protein [Edaphobacter lichenicola]MBB5317351.1 hypothetical protein [Edaphobacter lichenicola]